MTKYSSCADLLILAKLYHSKGRKVDAAKLAVKAMEEEDSEELFESLDQQNDMAAAEAGDEMESLTEEDLDIEPAAEAESEPEAAPEMEPEAPEAECKAEELPPVEEALASVLKNRKVMANKMTLSGSRQSRAELIAKLAARK